MESKIEYKKYGSVFNVFKISILLDIEFNIKQTQKVKHYT
jgi:hypothetical protein